MGINPGANQPRTSGGVGDPNAGQRQSRGFNPATQGGFVGPGRGQQNPTLGGGGSDYVHSGSPPGGFFPDQQQGGGGGGYSGYQGNVNRGGQQIINQWRGQNKEGTNAPAEWAGLPWWFDTSRRDAMEAYTRDYAVPIFNASLAQQTQDYNQFSDARNFGEQQWLNRNQVDLARQGSAREDLALKYGQENWGKEFGLNQELGRGQQQLDRDRLGLDERMGMGRLSLDQEMGRGRLNLDQELGRGRLNLDQELGRGQLGIDRQRADLEGELGRGRLSLDQEMGRGDLALRGELGRGELANSRFANEAQAARFAGMTENERFANQAQADRFGGMTRNEEFANLTGRMAEENRLALGQGDLSLRNRDLDLTNQYRQNQLSQEAALTREKFKNELLNTRMAATGRVAGRNQRAVRSWY